MNYIDKKISILDIIDTLSLKIIYCKGKISNYYVESAQVSRLALCLLNSFSKYEPANAMMVGLTEIEFLKKSSIEVQVQLLEKLYKTPPPLIVLSNNVSESEKCVKIFEGCSVPVVKTGDETLSFLSKYFEYLSLQLARSQTIHGVLMDIYGEGILITGKSGIGKSECAVELIRRGHKFVADDAVMIKAVNDKELVGMAPKNISNFLELRGIGVINIKTMFGVYKIKKQKKIKMEVRLQGWNEFSNRDRLFVFPEETEIFGIKIPRINIPVNSGRSIPVIIETAVMNAINRSKGYDATESLIRCLK